MKMWVINKRSALLIIALCLLVLTFVFTKGNDNIAVSGGKRDLPIYCVDKGDEKVVSLSFDAAWGNGIYGQCDIKH